MSPIDPRALHNEAIVIDGTCPLAREVPYIDWWREGRATALAPTVGGSEGPTATLKALGGWHRLAAARDDLTLVRRAADIEAAKEAGKLGLILHFQGTEPVADSLDLVDAYKALGVGMIQLAYNVKNRVGDGAEERTDAGLSRFGLRLIERMNQARIIVDCSHTGRRTTLDAIEASSATVVFSHANPEAVHESRRNITDEQIRAVAATGGLTGMNGYPGFVSSDPRPTVDQLIDHVDYVADLVGVDHIGVGIDYFNFQVPVVDDETAMRLYRARVAEGRWQPETYPPPPYHMPKGIETPRTLPVLTERLVERGYGAEDVKKILGANWLRVFRDVWGE